MSPEEWKFLEYRRVTVKFDYPMEVNLGEFLGCGGSGAVFDFPALSMPGAYDLVIKVLDPASQIMQQELKSIRKFRGHVRFTEALMKFRHWNGTLTVDRQTYPCYLMQKGKSLAEAVSSAEEWLNDQKESLRLMAFIVNGICSLKNVGLSHGDIKEDNILLVAYQNTQFYMLADYGTVSECETTAKSNHSYEPGGGEGKTPLEKRIAYDLHCLYKVFCRIYKIDDDFTFPETLSKECCKLLRIMRNQGMLAFDRLQKLMNELGKLVYVPVSFFLDAVPTYKLENDFPFDTVMEWDGHLIVRDKNVPPGEPFDPLLLMKIPSGRYKTVYDILVSCDRLYKFVMPIARYSDIDGNEYVLIHAPDDARKVYKRGDFSNERIQDSDGLPCTLEFAPKACQRNIIADFSRILSQHKVNIEFSAQNIWHMDKTFKLNIFSVDFIEHDKVNAELERARKIKELKIKAATSPQHLSGRQWVELISDTQKYAEKCDWSKLDGKDWSRLLEIYPQFSKICDWEKLNAEDWYKLLQKHPLFVIKLPCEKFADVIPFDKLDKDLWCRLLKKHPQFADKCQLWDQLDGKYLCQLLAEHPQFADRCNLEKIIEAGEDFALLLASQPQLANKCNMDNFTGKIWGIFLCWHPQFADKCDWSKLDGEDWRGVVSKYPQFADKCDWSKLDGENWSWLLWYKPQFADKCDWNKLDGYDWNWLLQHQPQFADKCDWDKLDGYNWSNLLQKQPQFADKCDWSKLNLNDFNVDEILSIHPHLEKYRK